MTGRIPFGFLSLLTVLVCVPIQAQDQMGPPPSNGVDQASFYSLHNEDEGPGMFHGIPLTYQRKSVPRTPGKAPPMIYEELPDDLGFLHDESPLGKMLTNTFRHAWFRGEYLLWNISAPGHVLLGNEPANGVFAVNDANPQSIYGNPGRQALDENVQFARTVDGVTGSSIAPFLNSISINNLNGFRGTMGLPFPVGTVEISSFVLQASSDSFYGGNTQISNFENGGTGIGTGYIQKEITANPSVLIGGNTGVDGNAAVNGQQAHFITQPVLVNGASQVMTTSSPGINYDVSYQARLTTQAWGIDTNFVVDSPDPNAAFQFRPLFGVRYFNYHDRLAQTGQYNEANAIDPTINDVIGRSITSTANNEILGPQLGVRAEAQRWRVQVGVEPKIMFGMNSFKTSLDTANVFSSTDRAQNLTLNGTTFSPLFDVKFYSNVAVSKNLSAYVSYNYLWVGQVNKSYNDIQYNQNTAGQSDFRILKNYSGATLQGLSLGFEYKY